MIDKNKIFHQNVVVQIFRDHWSGFKEFHPEYVTPEIERNVEKMVSCGHFSNGYAEYQCECGKIKRIAFSCKSRLCLRCSKVYIDNWLLRMKDILFTKVNHRHIILTIPDVLWKYLQNKDSLKLLSDCGAKLIKEVASITKKGLKIDLGIICAIQTSGRAGNFNPHLHLLVTEGGMDEKKRWHPITYFDYEILKKKWMYIILTALKERLRDNQEALSIIEELFKKRKDKGFIARAKREKIRKRDIVGYLVRYVSSPPITIKRITSYDGERVGYYYKEHPTNKEVLRTVSAFEFIRLLIQHLPAKGLKLIRHYGLYARNKVAKVRAILDEIFKDVKEISQGFFAFIRYSIFSSYRMRIKKSFGYDPLICPSCGKEMILFKIWHPHHGVIYDIFRKSTQILDTQRPTNVAKEEEKESNQRTSPKQLSLFAMPIPA